VTFAQITDAHLFDAGKASHGRNIFEEALDNRGALHWAILEINRTVAEGRYLDFVVFTGDWGLENVQLKGTSSRPVRCKCPRPSATGEGPIPSVTIDAAADELTRELEALVVPRVFLLPGDADLCNGDARDLHRYAEFVGELEKRLPMRIFDLTNTVQTDASKAEPGNSIRGIRLVALNSAGFGARLKGDEPDRAGTPTREFAQLKKAANGHGPILVFAHSVDIIDPGSKQPFWKIEDLDRKTWMEEIAGRPQLIAMFAGHLHASIRALYARQVDASLSARAGSAPKTFIAPPLAITGQDPPARVVNTPPPPAGRTARGFLIATVTHAGALSVQPYWYVTLDQKTASEGDAAIAQAGAAMLDEQWDDAANKFAGAMTSSDSRVRAAATQGYEMARTQMRSWWWQTGAYFPPIRWAHAYPKRTLTLILVCLALLFSPKVFSRSFAYGVNKILYKILVPRFRGKAYLPAPSALSPDARVDLFALELSHGAREVRDLLRWFGVAGTVAGPLPLLSLPSQVSSALSNTLPTIKGVDVNRLVAFLVSLTHYFGWRVESYLAFCSITAALGAPPPSGTMRSFASLRWAWFTKDSWNVQAPAGTAFDVQDVAFDLATRILWVSLQ
jgi:hypothetical protein